MNTPAHTQRGRGFTLMETVIVILVLGIASAAIINLNGQLFRQSGYWSTLQQATQIQQACIEKILRDRHELDYTLITPPSTPPNCSTIAAGLTGYTLTVQSVSPAEFCPTSSDKTSAGPCRQFTVSTATANTSTISTTLLFVSY
jgi:prepilin-type N-terminal cleavage/methylation domain-containing protein